MSIWHELPTLDECEKSIGVPTKNWVGNCHAIARAIVEAGLVQNFDGAAVYGYWGGPVHPDSHSADRAHQPFIRHGWILLEGGRILDPTRWCFDAKEPYLFIGDNSGEYDEGGDKYREETLEAPPPWDKEDSQYTITKSILATDPWKHVEWLLDCTDSYVDDEAPTGQLCGAQLFWLANCPYSMLEPHAAQIYKALERIGMKAFIPLDNRTRAQREAQVAKDKHEKHGQWFHIMESAL